MKVGQRDWTVLYYLNGTNDLEPKLVRNLLDAETIGSTDRVDLVAQLARAPQDVVHKDGKKSRLDGDWSGARRYHLSTATAKKGGQKKRIQSEVLAEMPLPDGGSPQALRDFLQWGKANFPAKHYMVVVGDHGKGFVGTGYDNAHKSQLDLGELKTALAESGLKPDVLVFDACMMGQLEVASQLQDQATYVVASEEIVGQDGLPHTDIAWQLVHEPKATPQQVARSVVELAGNDQLTRMEEDRPEAAVQLSALRMEAVPGLEKAVDGLARALEKAGVKPAQVAGARRASTHFGGEAARKPEGDFRDLGQFVSGLQADERLPAAVRAAAEKVQANLEKVVLTYTREGDGMEETEGLSVYLPPSLKGKDHGYRATDFAQRTRWDEWLAS